MRVEVIVCHILVYWFYLFLSFVLIGCTRPRRTVWNKWRSWKSSMCHKRRCLVPREISWVCTQRFLSVPKKTRKLSYERATRLVWQQTYSSILRISLETCPLLFSLNPVPFFIHNPEEVSFECVYVFLGSFLCLYVCFIRTVESLRFGHSGNGTWWPYSPWIRFIDNVGALSGHKECCRNKVLLVRP